MSEQYEIRRVGEHRRAGSSAAVNIPAKFLAGTQIHKHDYFKYCLEEDEIIMQKFQEKIS